VTGREQRTIIGWETLARGFCQAAIFMCLSLTLCLTASAQEKSLVTDPPSLEGKSAQGQLTVTATVVSSVGIVIGLNGELVLVVANAPAGRDSLAAISSVRQWKLTGEERSKAKKKTQQRPCHSVTP